MTSQLPTWLQVLTALLTPAIAIAVGIIGFLQWRTAHMKVVLDLFDRRRNLFYAVIEAIDFAMSKDGPSRDRAVGALRAAARDARFLFGAEVYDYLHAMFLSVKLMRVAETMIERSDGRADWAKQRDDQRLKLRDFYEKFPALCEPYLKLDQKRAMARSMSA